MTHPAITVEESSLGIAREDHESADPQIRQPGTQARSHPIFLFCGEILTHTRRKHGGVLQKLMNNPGLTIHDSFRPCIPQAVIYIIHPDTVAERYAC